MPNMSVIAPSRFELARQAEPGASPRVLAERAAASVIIELGLSAPPVPLDMVTSYLGIHEVRQVRGLAEAGCLVCGTENLILVRAGDSLGRTRFTIAHECSHTFFPGYHLTPQFRCSPQRSTAGDRRLERQCDQAAAELLMPMAMVRSAMANRPLSLDAADELASLFGASLAAAAARMIDASSTPAALLTFEPQVDRSGTEVLHLVSYHTQGQRWPWFRVGATVDLDSPIYDAYDGEIVSGNYMLTGICSRPIQAWVSAEIRPYRDRDGHLHRRVLAIVRTHG